MNKIMEKKDNIKVEQQSEWAEWIEYNALFSRILCSNCGVRFEGYEHCTLRCPECGKKMKNGRSLLSNTNTIRQSDITSFDNTEN